jgi:hypothetical protein
MKPRLTYHHGVWRCLFWTGLRTVTGYGATPKEAWDDWRRTFLTSGIAVFSAGVPWKHI